MYKHTHVMEMYGSVSEAGEFGLKHKTKQILKHFTGKFP